MPRRVCLLLQQLSLLKATAASTPPSSPTFSQAAVISLRLRNAAGFNALLPTVLYGQAAERKAELGAPPAPAPHWISATGEGWEQARTSAPFFTNGMQGTLLPLRVLHGPAGPGGAWHDLGALHASVDSPETNGTRFTSNFTSIVEATAGYG